MQRQQRIAAAHGAIDSYDGAGYCAEGYADNASDQYHAEVPSWVDECADVHWQPSGYVVALLPLITPLVQPSLHCKIHRVWKKRCHFSLHCKIFHT